jgi:hypothetical protein
MSLCGLASRIVCSQRQDILEVIRRVPFGKAILAGASGALAWEIVVRVLILLGLPLFDRFYFRNHGDGDIRPWMWWPAGIAMHATVGAIWAIFYAYFFWSTINSASDKIDSSIQRSDGPVRHSGKLMMPGGFEVEFFPITRRLDPSR